MKTNNVLTEEFYKNLFGQIINYKEREFIPESEDDDTCEIEVEFGNALVRLNVTFEIKYFDDSFDHAFGTYNSGHYEARFITDIDVEEVWLINDEDDIEVTEHFDEEMFWAQLRQEGFRDVKPGDEVIARTPGPHGTRVNAIYLYTDKQRGHHICETSLQRFEAISVKHPA